MSKTLYLIRQPIEHIHEAVFVPSETEGDVVLLEDSGLSPFPHQKGNVFSVGESQGQDASGIRAISYDELIEKIFQSDRTIVI
jgi:hypothetical protein